MSLSNSKAPPPTVRRADTTYSSAIAESSVYTDWLLGLFEGRISGSLLEVGVGHGSYAERLLDREHPYTGVDIDKLAVQEARARFPRGEFFAADIGDDGQMRPVGIGRFDTVLCFNVLEHVEDHRAALANLLAALRPGGHLLLFVPAFMGLFNDLDRLAGHHRRYTRRQVTSLLSGLPGQLVDSRYVNPIGGLGWWANRWASHDDLDGANVKAQIRTFLRFALPVSDMLMPLTKNIFGQSLVAMIDRT